MTLVNNSATDYALTSVSFSGASTVEIHETSMDEDVMRMRKVNLIDIPAHGSAELKPGSYHIMLIGLEKDLKTGTTETLTLTFSDGSQKSVEALVADLQLLGGEQAQIVQAVRELVQQLYPGAQEEVKYGGILFTAGVQFGGCLLTGRMCR